MKPDHLEKLARTCQQDQPGPALDRWRGLCLHGLCAALRMTSSSIVNDALLFATAAHGAVGQKRRYSNEAYIHHPIAVAEIVKTVPHNDSMVAAALLHATNNLVALGRSAGLRIVLITQRAAKLHKDALSQATGLVVMGLIDPRDQKAARGWLDGAPDQSRSKEIMASLASLPVGTGWIYAPHAHSAGYPRAQRGHGPTGATGRARPSRSRL